MITPSEMLVIDVQSDWDFDIDAFVTELRAKVAAAGYATYD